MIIDVRLRPPTEPFVSIQNNRVFHDLLQRARFGGTTDVLEKFVAEMDEAGVTMGVIQGRDIETTYGFKVPNEHVAEIVNAYPDRFVGLGGVDPHKGMAAVREVERCIKELKLKGISIDPYMHKKPANDRIYYPIYAKCCELGVPIMMTTGPGGLVPEAVIWDASPVVIDDVATFFPDLTIIISHGGWPWVNETIAMAFRHRNVYFDISGYERFPGGDHYVEGANTIVGDKILFASGHPYVPFKRALRVAEKMQLKDEVRENFMYKNAVRAFKLDIELGK